MTKAKALKATATATKGAEKKLSLEERWAKNGSKRATVGQAKACCGYLLNEVQDVPKGVHWGNLSGYFYNRLNLKKGYLTRNQVSQILSVQSFPEDISQAILAYKLEQVVKTSKGGKNA
jgi:hypothetical protein